MARRTTTRRVVTALAVLTATAAPGPLVVTAHADNPGGTAPAAERVFQADRYRPRADQIHSAGPHGYLHTQEGRSGYLWTSYDTGATTDVSSLRPLAVPGYTGPSSDTVVEVVSLTGKVVLRDLFAGTTTDVAFTHGRYRASFGGHVLTEAKDADGDYAPWLWGEGAPDGGTLIEGWPAGITANLRVLGGDSDTAALGYKAADGRPHLALVDLTAARVTDDLTLPVVPQAVVLSADRLVWHGYGNGFGGEEAHVLDRADLSAPGTTVTLPGREGTPTVGVAGRWLVVARTVPFSPHDLVDESGEPLMAVPLAGGEPITLLRHANASLVTGPDGSLLGVGGADSGHWAVRRIADTGADTPALTTLTAVPPVAATVDRLSLQNGTLATDEADSSFLGAYYTRRISPDGTPGAPTWHSWDYPVEGPYATGDGRAVTFNPDGSPNGAESSVRSIDRTDEAGFFYLPSKSGGLLDVTGRYAIVNGSSPTKQYVGDLGVYTGLQPIVTRSVTAASVWGTGLWTPGSGSGVVTAKDLKTGRTTDTVATGAPCVPKELQVVGRWIYWSCGPAGKAGVWDRTAKRSVPVPSGEALLGDGYLVRHDASAGALLQTAFADGTATTRKIGDLASDTAGRGKTWTVDKFGGPVAYVDADRRIHLVPSGVATQRLASIESEASDNTWDSGSARTPWWQWRGLLSKPAASWTATVTANAGGAKVRTLSGGPVQGNLTARWDLRDAKGAFVPNGTYTLQLTAPPADGSGPALTVSQTVRVSTGAAVRHDFTNYGTWAPDGTGDLLTLNSSGTISYRPGDGKGTFGKAMSASGWPTSVKPVPFGDLDGDRRSDILVRFSSGELMAYHTMRGQAFSRGTPHVSLGKGWNQYDVLTSPGDVTGDGRPDLVTRNSATGAVYLHKGTSTGKLAARVKLYADWKTYKKVVGVGDLNGDGVGDLIAQDRSNSLYRYLGTGRGTFTARVKLFTSWGASYNTVVGVGDITGDGKVDLVSRDTSGVLWRNNGDGKGSFGPRTKAATGWQGYKGVF